MNDEVNEIKTTSIMVIVLGNSETLEAEQDSLLETLMSNSINHRKRDFFCGMVEVIDPKIVLIWKFYPVNS